MDTVDLLETQKQREVMWVEEGKQRFLAHCSRTLDRGAVSVPAGSVILKRCVAAFQGRLEAFYASHAAGTAPMKDPTFLVLSALSVEHVAAVALHQAVLMVTVVREDGGDDIRAQNVVKKAATLGAALEHDLKFREFSDAAKANKDAECPIKIATDKAVARMKKDMEGTKGAWSKRLKTLRELVSGEWDESFRVTLGSNLLCLLVEACPETFSAPLINHGGRTIRVLRLTEDASASIATATDIAAVNHPRLGMMLVKPRPWRYVDA